VNNAAMNAGVQRSLDVLFAIPLALLGSMADQFLISLGLSILFSIMALWFELP
jgi:hypothetical protein